MESNSERSATQPGEERRTDLDVREQIRQLLSLIREFYTTCHMVAVGQLEPSKAKAKAQDVEEKLNAMTARMLERIESAGGSDSDGDVESEEGPDA